MSRSPAIHSGLVLSESPTRIALTRAQTLVESAGERSTERALAARPTVHVQHRVVDAVHQPVPVAVGAVLFHVLRHDAGRAVVIVRTVLERTPAGRFVRRQDHPARIHPLTDCLQVVDVLQPVEASQMHRKQVAFRLDRNAPFTVANGSSSSSSSSSDEPKGCIARRIDRECVARVSRQSTNDGADPLEDRDLAIRSDSTPLSRKSRSNVPTLIGNTRMMVFRYSRYFGMDTSTRPRRCPSMMAAAASSGFTSRIRLGKRMCGRLHSPVSTMYG
uniref:Uncharacterized protein n=1 Tax=Anopheles melas TaxID=34690 RepID=A0A182TEG3_9DIPT